MYAKVALQAMAFPCDFEMETYDAESISRQDFRW